MRKIANCESRIANWRLPAQFAVIFGLLGLPALARCPISPNGTLKIQAAVGNLIVEPTGGDSVDVDVTDNAVKLQETCAAPDSVLIESSASTQLRNGKIPDWRIRVPKSVNLDFVAHAGGVTLTGDYDGAVILRTTGGSVTVRNVRGNTTIVTQGGFIKAGNIGGAAELRSQGNLEVGNVGGAAMLKTTHGFINAGVLAGPVRVETEGGSIRFRETRGEVHILNTRGGDISIGTAASIDAKTDGGNIVSRLVREWFKGRTEAGDIRISQAHWVEASTGAGNIEVHIIPADGNRPLHVALQSDRGDVFLYLDERIKATVEAIVDKKPIRSDSRIYSDWDVAEARRQKSPIVGVPLLAPQRESRRLNINGGGDLMNVKTSFGTIEIRKNF